MNTRRNILSLPVFLLLSFSATLIHAQDIQRTNLKEPIKFSGSVNLQLEAFSASGIDNRKKPYTWLISGNPSVAVFGVQVPFFFLFSNFENRYFQPFNQFGVSPSYKWVRLHLGYRNIEFSPFTLAGYRMLGAGVELTPGKLRFGFMYGRLNRSTSIDSAQNVNPLGFRMAPSYTRIAYAVKVGFGSAKSYFDISYLKGWDVESSLRKDLRDSVAPQENKVLGVSWQKTMWKKIVWKTDIGISIYTQDIHASGISDSSDQYKGLMSIGHFLQLNVSSQLLVAGETRLGFHDKKFGADLVYRRVDPDYRSMGAYFFQTDVEQYSIAPYARVDHGKLFINGNIGTQHDNLYDLKLATSNRIIGNVNITFNPSPRFGASFNYSNFGITQNPTRTSPDSSLFKQVSQNFTLVPYANLVNDRIAQNFQLVAAYMLLNNTTQAINATSNQNTMIGALIYSRTWLKSSISGNVSLNYNNTKLPQGDIGSYGIGMGANAPLIHKKATANANVVFNNNVFNEKSNGYTINADIGGAVPVNDQNTIQVQFIYLNNQSKDNTVVQTFSEYTFRIIYGFRFK